MIFGDPAREVKPFEGKFGTGGTLAVGLRAEAFGYFVQDLEVRKLVEKRLGRDRFTGDDRIARLHSSNQHPEVDSAESYPNRIGGRATQQVLEHLQFPSLFTGFELDLAAKNLDHGLEIDGPCNRIGLAEHRRASYRRCTDGFRAGDGKSCRHTRSLIHRGGFA